jgi:hypothetical protein
MNAHLAPPYPLQQQQQQREVRSQVQRRRTWAGAHTAAMSAASFGVCGESLLQ